MSNIPTIEESNQQFVTDETGSEEGREQMEGYYDSEYSGKGLETPTGQLNIEVKNLPEFKELVEQAKYQAGQLQQTINRLSNFELKIDFSCGKEVTSK